MFKFFLLCLLASQGINGKPVRSIPSDLASHILIVTPQAQVQYEALAPTTFIQHLSPLARFGAPHDETIIYVPSGAGVDAAALSVARSSAPALSEQPQQLLQQLQQKQEQAQRKASIETKQYEQISQQIEQIQSAIQQGSSSLGPQLSEAASAAAMAASNAGSGLFPALFPPASIKEDKLKVDKIEYESLIPVSAESRRFYALTPAVSHVFDFVHAPVFVGPLSAIRARSIPAEAKESAAEAVKSDQIAELKTDLIAKETLLLKEETQLKKEILEKEPLLSIEPQQQKLLEEPHSLKEIKEPQPEQLLVEETFKQESIKTAEPKLAQIAEQPLRAASGRVDVGVVAPVSGHHQQPQELQQQQAVSVPVDLPVVPVFVPQAKTV